MTHMNTPLKTSTNKGLEENKHMLLCLHVDLSHQLYLRIFGSTFAFCLNTFETFFPALESGSLSHDSFVCLSNYFEYFFRAFKANPPQPPSHSFHVVSSLRYPLMVKDDLCPAYFLSILCLQAVLVVLCERSPTPHTACRSFL